MKGYLHELIVHDTYIYGYGIDGKKHELYFDVDIIIECIKKDDSYRFKVCPATIVFKNVWDIVFDISTDDDIIVSQVGTVLCGTPRNSEYINCKNEYEVNIECLQGSISFKTIGGHLVIKGEEKIMDKVNIGISPQRPISFCVDGEIVEFEIGDQSEIDV